MSEEMKLMFNAIIEEMGRMESRINKRMDERFDKVDQRFDKIEQRLDMMQHEINACKLEAGTLDLLLKKIEELERRSA